MKKLLTILIAVLMLFAFVACSLPESSDNDVDQLNPDGTDLNMENKEAAVDEEKAVLVPQTENDANAEVPTDDIPLG